MLGEPWRVQFWVAPASTSLALSWPLMLTVPGTAVPSSAWPASVTAPAKAAAALVITGTSLVPLSTTVTLMTLPSVAVTLNVAPML